MAISDAITETTVRVSNLYRSGAPIPAMFRNGKIIYRQVEYTAPVQDTHFTISNNTANAGTITFTKSGSAPTITFKTSTDGCIWTDNTVSATTTFTLPANGYVKFEGENDAMASSTANTWTITSNVSHNISGDLSTLSGAYCPSLFKGDTQLVNASGLTLSQTVLTDACYFRMFYGCSNLLYGPELQATTMAWRCYSQMFRGCTSMVYGPSTLPAMNLADYCYEAMFLTCSSLTRAPSLPATTLQPQCYQLMFRDCTSLVTAPVLSAETLNTSSYNSMFRGCTSLTSITCLATDITATTCTSNWVYGITTTGIFTCPSSMASVWGTGNSGIPTTWTRSDYISS